MGSRTRGPFKYGNWNVEFQKNPTPPAPPEIDDSNSDHGDVKDELEASHRREEIFKMVLAGESTKDILEKALELLNIDPSLVMDNLKD